MQWIFNRFPSVLKSIQHVQFIQLKHLTINFSEICSLGAIAYLDMPNIQYIDLGFNKISCIKPLNKVNWTQIKKLFLVYNELSEAHVGRARFFSIKRG
jgi:Leucine-rich repeat (LRR) protein